MDGKNKKRFAVQDIAERSKDSLIKRNAKRESEAGIALTLKYPNMLNQLPWKNFPPITSSNIVIG